MPPITSYLSSVVLHEARFTPHFAGLGYRYLVAFPGDPRASDHPIMDQALQLVRDGCPIVKRRLFFHDPLYNESRALDGRELVDTMARAGYPVEGLYANLARTSVPRSMITNLALLDVLPDTDLEPAAPPSLRVVAVAHIYYPEMTDELVDRLDHLGAYDLVVTTADEERRASIRETLARRGRDADVRLVTSNRGRDISAFFIDCRDVIEGDHDLVVKIHSKRSPQDGPVVGEMFKRHLFDNLLSSPGYVANLLRLFERHSSLGMVIPPIYHIAYPTLGLSWFQNKVPAQELADRIGITVPFDTSTPVAAYGSMFIARPHTLRALAAAGLQPEDFPDEGGYKDGAMSHVVERLMAYSVLSSGHHVREVMNPRLAAVNYSYLEYRAVTLGEALGPYPRQAVKRVKRLKQFRKAAKRAGLDPVPFDDDPAPRTAPRAADAPAPEPTPVGGPLRAVGRRARDTVRRTTTRGGSS
jgi:rhamnosyltransferase